MDMLAGFLIGYVVAKIIHRYDITITYVEKTKDNSERKM